MAAAATAILSDGPLLRGLAANAAADAAERFDFEAQLDATIAWYRESVDEWTNWKSRAAV